MAARKKTTFKKALPPETLADQAVRLIHTLRYTAGSTDKVKLRPWQEEIIRGIFAVGDDGLRVVRRVLLLLPRKHAKTECIAWCCLVMLLIDPEPSQRICAAAKTLKQATFIFTALHTMIKNLIKDHPETAEYFDVSEYHRRVKVIKGPREGNYFESIASDAGANLGGNWSVVCFDEVLEGDRALWDALATSQSARKQPLFLAISTAGVHDPEGLLWTERQYALSLTNTIINGKPNPHGSITNPKYFARIWEAPQDCGKTGEWANEALWFECSPALGDFKEIEDLREKAKRIAKIPQELNAFLQLDLNVWVDASDPWVAMADWDGCKVSLPLEKLRGKPCKVGLDLSSGGADTTAAAAVFPDITVGYKKDGSADVRSVVVTAHFVPDFKKRERSKRDDVSYQTWEDGGHLTVTPGRTVDYRFVVERLKTWRDVNGFDIKNVAYDPKFAPGIIPMLEDEGFSTTEVIVSEKGQTAATQHASNAIVNREYGHLDNPVMNWMVSGAVTKRQPDGGVMLSKAHVSRGARIDGPVAMVYAQDALIREPLPTDPWAALVGDDAVSVYG